MNTNAGEHGTVFWTGVLKLEGPLRKAEIDGWTVKRRRPGEYIFMPKPNLVVNTGINMRLDRLFAISGPPAAVGRMGVDNGASNPVAGTTSSGANTKTLRTFDSTPTRSSQVLSAIRTFDQSTVNFAMKRFFLSNTSADLTNATTADDANSLHSMTNSATIDLTAFTTWSLVVTAQVTGTGS